MYDLITTNKKSGFTLCSSTNLEVPDPESGDLRDRDRRTHSCLLPYTCTWSRSRYVIYIYTGGVDVLTSKQATLNH